MADPKNRVMVHQDDQAVGYRVFGAAKRVAYH
jgi:hypothetical protein